MAVQSGQYPSTTIHQHWAILRDLRLFLWGHDDHHCKSAISWTCITADEGSYPNATAPAFSPTSTRTFVHKRHPRVTAGGPKMWGKRKRRWPSSYTIWWRGHTCVIQLSGRNILQLGPSSSGFLGSLTTFLDWGLQLWCKTEPDEHGSECSCFSFQVNPVSGPLCSPFLHCQAKYIKGQLVVHDLPATLHVIIKLAI